MGKKKNNNAREFFSFDVTKKGIRLPKKLRKKITSYRRIGFGPNEKDVLIGEVVNGKYYHYLKKWIWIILNFT